MDKNKIFTVATAHLDTVWRWDLKKTIEEYLPDTVEKNISLFEKYPNYKFNFEGAYRYELIEEYYPWYFEKIKEYIDKGNWSVCGSAYENGDVNIPSPEAILRNFIYGNEYFKEKFGKTSCDVFLPDCFGFGWALPSIAKHYGLKGFTTQKLSWGCAYPRPFDLGVWKGVDSSSIYANLNAQTYRYKFNNDVRGDLSIINKISQNANMNNLPWTLNLYGDGDIGGSPDEESVRNVCNSAKSNENEHTEVIISSADEIYNELDKLDSSIKDRLCTWNNELVMTNHGVGAYTSRGMSKRLNSKNETLADICERSCVLANAITTYNYPHKTIDQAWKRVIKHQFHDDITGTSNMQVYNDSWNDYFVSLNQFSNEYEGAVNVIAKELDTSWVKECAVIVNNPASVDRQEAVEAQIKLKHNTTYIKVFDKDNNEIPSQIVSKSGKEFDIIFLANVKSNGYKVYDVRCSDQPCNIKNDLKVTLHTLENNKYKVVFNKNGDIASIIDKKLKVQLLSSPIKFALLHDKGALDYPSWELRKEDIDAEPYCYANTPNFEIIDNGPARISIKIRRSVNNSTIEQIVSLDSESEAIRVYNFVDWNERRSLLKLQFPLTCNNEVASYDLGLGFIKRPNNSENLYEVPAQKWADISDEYGQFGVSIFSDCKYGWDKPNDNILRLSCIHTPTGAFTNETRQDLQDIGRNIFSFGIFSHESSKLNRTQIHSECFNKPMIALQTTTNSKGKFGDEISLLNTNNDSVLIRAIKKSQNDDSIIVRVNESAGCEQKNVEISLFDKIKQANEVYGSEEFKQKAKVENGKLIFDLKPFEIKSFAINLNTKKSKLDDDYIKIDLDYNTNGITSDASKVNVILQGSGCSLPQELIDDEVVIANVPFKLENKNLDKNLVIMRGQTIALPENSKKLYILAASTLDNRPITIMADNREKNLIIDDMRESYAKWDMAGLDQTAKIKNSNIGIEFTHTHHPSGNLANEKAYFYVYEIDVRNCTNITFPIENRVAVMAMTVSTSNDNTRLATSIIDKVNEKYEFKKLAPLDKIIDKSQFATIKAGEIQKEIKKNKNDGLKNSKIFRNIIRTYTKKK